ncbi:DUF4019 domain-containing protein [Lysobacter soli]|uniref:DUF4019 domain-containing protein n=1 Tax=Lysobacter soli TaxID=453783 RepID=UPI00209EF013|nr:DUF4019 domain-containing protein [Lysobacter soli]UTA55335.1 DUF4019 domain-containing protein [Lysobacter soli]
MNARLPLAIALLFGASFAAIAQTRPAAPPQAAPAKPAAVVRAAPSVDPNAVVQAALTVAQLIDQEQTAQVWQGASPVARAATTEKQFVDGIATRRNALGTPVSREWTSVSRNLVPTGGNVPAGAYVSARFQTRFSTNRVAEELVSLHYDDDNTWRLAGYTIN